MPRQTEDYFTKHVGKQYYVHFIDDSLIADSLKFANALRWHFSQEAEGNRDWSLTGPVNGKWRIHAWVQRDLITQLRNSTSYTHDIGLA
ncbi:hypothetical protein Forpe1208_v011485 [Fusarium oxysporum f. sp. rapae]|uniref:Uncharacterized protein n=1 Tax=Fusarium oxysporum f. sp. rapae TaxID=485398 RepID=A0A8J5NWV2_FUSOX|nr:hypothetical protein Forpe1208_v011485 [Fusarium oxysporum f. sp. rapae]